MPGHAGAALLRGQSIASLRKLCAVTSVPSPMSSSPAAAVSVSAPWATRKSIAYQSLQASPIAPACAVFSAPEPPSVMSRFESPCVYSW